MRVSARPREQKKKNKPPPFYSPALGIAGSDPRASLSSPDVLIIEILFEPKFRRIWKEKFKLETKMEIEKTLFKLRVFGRA